MTTALSLPAAGQLYGVWAGAGGKETVFSINAANGAMTPLVATGASTLVGGISTFDPVGKRFFFMSNLDLYTVNVTTGAASHVSLGGTLPLLQFDAVTNTLFGVALQGNQAEVFAIDTTTGVMTPRIATGATTLAGGISAFDPAGRRLFFMSDPDLYVVNVDSGTFSHVSLGHRFPLLQFDITSRTLFGIWDLSGQAGVYSIDPATGVMTAQFATGAPGFVGGIITFNPFSRDLFFMSNTELYSANVATQSASHVSLGGAFPLLQFDAPPFPVDAFDRVALAFLFLSLAMIGFLRVGR